MAQSGSALQWGCRGRGFKSRRPDWFTSKVPVVQLSLSIYSETHLFRSRATLLALALTSCGGGSDRAPASKAPAFSASLQIDTAAMTRTPSGLRYQDVTQGEGKEAKAGQTVSVHYTGWLPNGEKFDSSRDRNQPFDFTLGAGQVIAGWDEGVAGMKVGGKRKLVIPPDLAYGTAGAPPDIPPGATLVFEVELLAVR